MRKLKTSLILLLTIFLSSCAHVQLPILEDQERCVVSIELNRCRCHMYRVTKEKVGRVSESVNKPISYCEKLVGFKPTSWIKFVLWFEEAFEAVEDANEDEFFDRPDVESEEDIMSLVDEVELN